MACVLGAPLAGDVLGTVASSEKQKLRSWSLWDPRLVIPYSAHLEAPPPHQSCRAQTEVPLL